MDSLRLDLQEGPTERMSKTKTKPPEKKLKLEKTTLRALTPGETGQAHGGVQTAIAATRYCAR